MSIATTPGSPRPDGGDRQTQERRAFVPRGFGDKRVAIDGGHGRFTTDRSADEAAWWFVQMNRCCEAQLMAQACGTRTLWATEDARWLASVSGSSQFGWLSFQTLCDDIVLSAPDLGSNRRPTRCRR